MGSRRRWRWMGAVLCAVLSSIPLAAIRSQAATDAERFNGTWRMRIGDVATQGYEWHGELRVWALDARRVRLEFDGHYGYKTRHGPSANLGQAEGIGVLERGKVSFRDEYGCAFTLALRGERMVVEQTEFDCFGARVTAEGTYERVNAGRPEFGIPDRGARP